MATLTPIRPTVVSAPHALAPGSADAIASIVPQARFVIPVAALTVLLPVPFRVLFAVPIDSNTLRVYLRREPKRVSPLSANDVLLRDNWSISIPADPAVAAPEVESVGNALYAGDYLLTIGIVEPSAWSVDLRTARRLVFGPEYLVVASTAIRSADGADLLPPDPYDRATFPGIVEGRPRIPQRPARAAQEGLDYRYSTFDARYLLDGKQDVDAHAGIEALKKRILRRLMSSPGGFYHLPRYGLGARVKELLRPSQIADLRARALAQVLEEPEVAEASVDSTFSGGVLIVSVRAKTRSGIAFGLGFSRGPNGELEVT